MAEHDGKVVFDLEIDDSKVRGDLNRTLNNVRGQLNGQKVKIGVEADVGSAITNLNKAKSAAHDLESSDPTVTVEAQTGSANTALQVTKKKADDLEASDPTVSVDAQTGSANTALDRTKSKADDLEAADPTVTVDAQTASANALLDGTKSKADDLESSDPIVTVDAETGSANALLDATLGKAQALEASDPVITVTANTSQADAALDATLGRTSSASGGAAGLGSNTLAKVGGTAAALNYAKQVFTSGLDYEKGLAQVSTLMPEGADKSAFGASLLALSSEMGIPVTTLLETAYNGLSASVPYGNAQGDTIYDFVRQAAMLSVGGFTTPSQAGDALSSVYNAYNGQIPYGDISNLMLKTQNKGKITVDQIAQSVAQITPAASVSGIGFDQVGAMWAALTAGGVQPAQAATQIRAMINELNTEGSKGNESMKKALAGTEYAGKSLSQIMAMGGDMTSVLSAIQSLSASQGKELTNYFSSSEAAGAIAFLTGENQGRFNDALSYMRNGENIVGSAYGTMANTTGTTWNRLKEGFKNFGTGIFQKTQPFINGGLELFTNPGAFFSNVGTFFHNTAMNGGWFPTLQQANDYVKMKTNPGQWATEHGGGVISKAELEAMRPSGTGRFSEFTPVAYGARDDATTGSVAKMQSALTKLGYFVGEIDGIFGTRTQSGVKEFQKSKGLAQTGELDAETAAALAAAMAEMESNIESANTSAEAAGESLSGAAESADGISEEANEVKASLFGANTAMKAAGTGAKRISSSVSTVKSYLASAGTAMSGLPSAIQALVNAANSAAKHAASGGGAVSPGYATAKAVGLDYVPYDNYPALLHKGEMILTAAQASSFRHGGSASYGGGMDYNALASALRGMAVEMDGRTVGRLVERSVSTQQATRLGRMSYRG